MWVFTKALKNLPKIFCIHLWSNQLWSNMTRLEQIGKYLARLVRLPITGIGFWNLEPDLIAYMVVFNRLKSGLNLLVKSFTTSSLNRLWNKSLTGSDCLWHCGNGFHILGSALNGWAQQWSVRNGSDALCSAAAHWQECTGFYRLVPALTGFDWLGPSRTDRDQL